MNTVDFKMFFLKGKFFDFSLGMIESAIIRQLGEPSEIEDYGNDRKFLHYDDLRLYVSNDGLEYLDFFFLNTDLSFAMEFDEQEFIINKDFGIAQVLQLLNLNGLKWDIPYEASKLDYLVIEVDNGLRIYYYYNSGQLERITKVF